MKIPNQNISQISQVQTRSSQIMKIPNPNISYIQVQTSTMYVFMYLMCVFSSVEIAKATSGDFVS